MRHNAHAGGDVGAVRDFDAKLAAGRSRRAHDVRNDVHRAAFHRTVEKRPNLFFGLRGCHPVVRRARVSFFLSANEGEAFGAGNVVGITTVEITAGVGLLIQLDESAIVEHQLREALVFGL
jgi:hypothetical protein